MFSVNGFPIMIYYDCNFETALAELSISTDEMCVDLMIKGGVMEMPSIRLTCSDGEMISITFRARDLPTILGLWGR